MMGALLVVTGTGTGIGKTHVSEAVLLAARARGLTVRALKPVETGVEGGLAVDRARLEAAAEFHVKQPALRQSYPAPLSPHLAARRARRPVDVPGIVRGVRAVRAEGAPVLVELPGGLFSPLRGAPRVLDNAHLAARLGGHVVLVVPDRLGALHDARAAHLAARARGVLVAATLFVQPSLDDSSTLLNANAFRDLHGPPVLGTVPRGTPAALSRTPAVRALLAEWLRGAPQPAASRPRSSR
jgi:dethiobiotin synthetase